MASPNPLELRQRIVDAYENGEGTYREIAVRFGVGPASVSRYLQLHRHSKNLAPLPMGGSELTISEEQEELLCTLVVDEPNWTTQELADELNGGYGIIVSRFTVGRALRRLGFSFKRGSSVHQPPEEPTSSRHGDSTSATKPRWTRTA